MQMQKKTKKKTDRRALWVRVVAIAIAVLMIGTTLTAIIKMCIRDSFYAARKTVYNTPRAKPAQKFHRVTMCFPVVHNNRQPQPVGQHNLSFKDRFLHTAWTCIFIMVIKADFTDCHHPVVLCHGFQLYKIVIRKVQGALRMNTNSCMDKWKTVRKGNSCLLYTSCYQRRRYPKIK